FDEHSAAHARVDAVDHVAVAHVEPVVVKGVNQSVAQEGRALLEVVVPVVVKRDVRVGRIAVGESDQASSARVQVVVVRDGDVGDTGLHVEQGVEPLGFAAAGFQGVVVYPDIVDAGFHANRIATVGDGRAALFDVLDV